MFNLTTTKNITLLLFSLLIGFFSVDQAKADVRINIGLENPYRYSGHGHNDYIVHHHSPRYKVSQHHHYYSPRQDHHRKSYRGFGHHNDHYRHDYQSHQRDYGHRHYR